MIDKILLVSLLIFFGTLFADVGIYKPRLKDGEVTLQSVLSLYIDAITTRFCGIMATATWSDSLKNYVGMTWNTTTNEGASLWNDMAKIIAYDGTDEQVARTGISRDEHFRRLQAYHAKYVIDGKVQTRDEYLAMVQKANQIWASGVTDSIPSLLLRPEKARIFMGFNQNHDYGDGPQHFTCPSVPQDFADPRIVAGKSVKEWATRYKIARSLTDGRDSNGYAVVNSYSPDFSGDHHNVLTDVYPLAAIFTHAEPPYITSLMKGKPPKLNERAALNHKRDHATLVMRHTSELGYYNAPCSYYTASVFAIQLASVYAEYGQKEALGFLARGLESEARGLQKGIKVDWALDRLRVWGYYVLRLTGVDLGPCPAYKEASKIVHGSYWYKYYRYGIHRTPDKMVLLAWNGVSRNSGYTGINTELSEYMPKSGTAFAGRTALIPHCWNGEMPSSFDFVTTQIIPDNDDFLPDSENYFARTTGNMQGHLDNITGDEPRYVQAFIDVKEDRSDGVFSTAGNINMGEDSIGSYARQYQSFTSFYNKMCISMVQIRPGTAKQAKIWKGGFSLSFSTNKASPVSGRTCFYEGDSLDLNEYAVPTPDASQYNYYSIPALYKNLTGSKWWSIHDRLGIAILGGDQGYFKVYPAWCKGTARGGLNDPAAMIGFEAPLGTADSNGNQLSMVAAYFTDTPKEKVKALQATMKSIDDQLPAGWKGVTSSTSEDQRVLALARLLPTSAGTADFKLSFPEGAPVLECATTIIHDTASGRFSFDTLESWGQTMAFYVSGAGDTVVAEQIGDISIRLKGKGSVTLKYLSKTNTNTLYVNGVASTKTKQELLTGASLSLTQSWTDVRIVNTVDDDHSGPAVEVISPEYITDYNTRGLCSANFWDPKNTIVGDSGLQVKVRARDRSGVAYVKIYLDWILIDSLTQVPYELTIPKDRFLSDSIHAIHAIACDVLGNEEESFSVPFKVTITGTNGVERMNFSRTSVNSTTPIYRSSINPIEKSMPSKTVKSSAMSRIIASGSWAASGYVQPKKGLSSEASCIIFLHKGTEYVFGLDAAANKVIMFRKKWGTSVRIGEASMKVNTKHWYDLKVQISDDRLVGYVNGEEYLNIAD